MKKELVPKLRFPEFVDSGDWNKTTFGETATFINGRAYKQEELLEKGKYRVLRVGNFFTNNEWYYSDLELEENKYCDNGDLLYAWSASFAPKIWKGEKVIYHYHIWKVIEKKNIDKSFLFILLDYETERMKSQSANGLGLLHITKGTIESWICRVPKIKEQTKIAACLSSLDDLITAQTQKIEALKNHKKGLMQQLFPQEGETVPKLRFSEFSGDWEVKKLKDLSLNGFSNGVFNAPAKVGSGYKLINVLDMYIDTVINENNLNLLELSKAEFEKNKVEYGDIFFTRSSLVKEGIAHSNVYLGNSEDVTFDGHLIRMRPKKEFNSIFLNYILKTSKVRSQFVARGKTATMTTIGQTDIATVTIQIPILSEQTKIADCLSSLDDLINAHVKKCELLKTHKKGLMQGLFPSSNE